MRIVIVGCGKVGTTLAEQLNREKHEIVLIEKNPEVLQGVTNTLDLIGVAGNGASDAVLREAGAATADLLIAVTTTDELNLLCCLIAKKVGVRNTIARVRNPEYSQEIRLVQEDLGLSMVINPEFAAAAEIAQLLRFPSAIKIDTFAKGRAEILKLHIPAASALDGMRIRDISSRLRTRVLVCAVERGDAVEIPTGDYVLRQGDRVSIVASPRKAVEFFRKAGVTAGRVNTAMLVGGGKITYYLARQLIEDGIQVKIIEMNKTRCEELSELLPEAMILQGDGTDRELLAEEGLSRMDAFASLTDVDEENVLLSLYAGAKSKAKLITKINRLALEEIVSSMPLGSIISPKFITAEHIVRYVRAMQNSLGSNVETLYKIVDNQVEALEFRVREKTSFLGQPLETLPLRNNLLVACINRQGRIITPSGKDTLELGDTVVVVTTNTGLSDLKDILRA